MLGWLREPVGNASIPAGYFTSKASVTAATDNQAQPSATAVAAVVAGTVGTSTTDGDTPTDRMTPSPLELFQATFHALVLWHQASGGRSSPGAVKAATTAPPVPVNWRTELLATANIDAQSLAALGSFNAALENERLSLEEDELLEPPQPPSEGDAASPDLAFSWLDWGGTAEGGGDVAGVLPMPPLPQPWQHREAGMSSAPVGGGGGGSGDGGRRDDGGGGGDEVGGSHRAEFMEDGGDGAGAGIGGAGRPPLSAAMPSVVDAALEAMAEGGPGIGGAAGRAGVGAAGAGSSASDGGGGGGGGANAAMSAFLNDPRIRALAASHGGNRGASAGRGMSAGVELATAAASAVAVGKSSRNIRRSGWARETLPMFPRGCLRVRPARAGRSFHTILHRFFAAMVRRTGRSDADADDNSKR